MTIQELKDSILKYSLANTNNEAKSCIIHQLFEKYEKENQASETENQSSSDTDIKKYIDEKLENYRQLNARYNMGTKAEIKTMQKEIENTKIAIRSLHDFCQGIAQQTEISFKEVDEKISKSINIGATETKPKQERFCYKFFDKHLGYDRFKIKDMKKIINFEYVYSEIQVIEICKALNQLEDLK